MVFKSAIFFKKEYGISSATLRLWAEDGRLEHIRMPGGKRIYSVTGVTSLLGQRTTTTTNTDKYGIIYARVSTSKQHGDLERQISDLKEAYPGYQLIQDIGSGVNFKRHGLQTLLERVLSGMVKEVVIMHRDRLARIGYELLEFVCSKAGTRIVVHGEDEGAYDEHDLADDLLAVTTLFVASHNGRRAAANRKRRREEKAKVGTEPTTTGETNSNPSN
jgi:predicted site-specific integrase-resolvase